VRSLMKPVEFFSDIGAATNQESLYSMLPGRDPMLGTDLLASHPMPHTMRLKLLGYTRCRIDVAHILAIGTHTLIVHSLR